MFPQYESSYVSINDSSPGAPKIRRGPVKIGMYASLSMIKDIALEAGFLSARQTATDANITSMKHMANGKDASEYPRITLPI